MSYPGGKGASGVVQTIINQQPPHDVYVEAFLGGGAVMKAKRPDEFNLAFDLDPSTIAKFRDVARWMDAPIDLQVQCGITFLESDARELDGSALIYCDPPYLFSTRRQSRRLYRYEISEADHRRILEAVRSLRCMVQISSYFSPLYAVMLRDWRLVKFQSMTRGGLREECLWMNYPEPDVLHDFRFLGNDYRERERIKRKARRWVSRLDSLPRLERLAIYREMTCSIDEYSDVAGGTNVPAGVRGAPSSEPAIGSRCDRTAADLTVPAIATVAGVTA